MYRFVLIIVPLDRIMCRNSPIMCALTAQRQTIDSDVHFLLSFTRLVLFLFLYFLESPEFADA